MIEIYCDGACSGNPGPGGWAYCIPELNIKGLGYAENTTNNRMEIFAVIEALRYAHLNNEFSVKVITDSRYVVNTLTQDWKRNKNTDLWNALDAEIKHFTEVKWQWVKGHASNEYNNECDRMAVYAYKTKAENRLYTLNTDSLIEIAEHKDPPVYTPEEIFLSFKILRTFQYNGYDIDIYSKVLPDSLGEGEITYYLGFAAGQIVTNNCMPLHTRLEVVENNARYYIDQVFCKNGSKKYQDLRGF
jgi:ribonuclease HI